MKRRAFITLLTAWPLAARAQQRSIRGKKARG
jgi:hypothetical protein